MLKTVGGIELLTNNACDCQLISINVPFRLNTMYVYLFKLEFVVDIDTLSVTTIVSCEVLHKHEYHYP